MVTIVDGEVLSAQKINDNLNHTLLEPKPYNAAVGAAAATAAATFMKIGKLVLVEFAISFTGAGTGGSIYLTTPSQMASTTPRGLGAALAIDGGATSTRRSFTVVPGGSAGVVVFNVDSLAANALVAATVPWTWAASDIIAGQFTYMEA